MSWFINGIKEWSTDFTTTFNTSQSTTTTFSTSRSTTTTFSTSRSTTTTFSTSRSTTTTFNTSKTTSTTTTVTTYGNTNNGSVLADTGRWIVYQSYNVAHMNYTQGHWYNQATPNENTGRQDFSDYNSNNVNPITADGWTYYKGNVWNNETGSCCGGVNWVYNNILYRTSSANTSFTTTYSTSTTTTTTFNTSQSTTTTFNTTRSTTTTFNTTRSTTTTFSTSRTTERTTDFYA